MLNCCLLNGLVVLAHCAFQSKHALLLFQCTFNGHKATSRPNLGQASGQHYCAKPGPSLLIALGVGASM